LAMKAILDLYATGVVKPTGRMSMHKQMFEEMQTVSQLSKLSYVSEYVEIMRCFAASAGGGKEQKYQALKAFLGQHWLSHDEHNPVGEFSEAQELARAFKKQICAEESRETLDSGLQGVEKRYVRAQGDRQFWGACVGYAHEIFAEEEERRAKWVKRQVMGTADMEAVLDLPRVEDAVEYVEILRCWNGLSGGGSKAEARAEKLKEKVAGQWREHNEDKKTRTAELNGAKDLAHAMKRQIIACESTAEMAAYLQTVSEGYPRAQEDVKWWLEFYGCAAMIYDAHWMSPEEMSLEGMEMDMEALLELPRLLEAVEYVEILRCWHGRAGEDEASCKWIKDFVARKWLDHNKHKTTTLLNQLEQQSEAERLANVLVKRIAVCESFEEVKKHMDNLKKGYTRMSGDSRWWVSFEGVVWKIYMEEIKSIQKYEKIVYEILDRWSAITDQLPRLSLVREVLEMEKCWLGLADTHDKSYRRKLERAEKRWLEQKQKQKQVDPVGDEDDAEVLAAHMKKRFDVRDSCLPHAECFESLVNSYKRREGDWDWWLRFWLRLFELAAADIGDADNQAMATAVGEQIKKTQQKLQNQVAEAMASNTSKIEELNADMLEAGTDDKACGLALPDSSFEHGAKSSVTSDVRDKEDTPEAWAIHEASRLAEIFRPKILACKTISDFAVPIAMAWSTRPGKWLGRSFKWLLLQAFLPIWMQKKESDISDPEGASESATESRDAGGAEVQHARSAMAAFLADPPLGALEIRNTLQQELARILEGCEVRMHNPELVKEYLRQRCAEDVLVEAEIAGSQNDSSKGTEKTQPTLDSGGEANESGAANEAVAMAWIRRDHQKSDVRDLEQGISSKSETVGGDKSPPVDASTVPTDIPKPEHGPAQAADRDDDIDQSMAETIATKEPRAAQEPDWEGEYGANFIATFFPREAELGIWSFGDVPKSRDDEEYRRMF
ncbi:MAG: hypothetical protein JWP34_4920, partial [Massilia sp.]|nr:hypothetical protein [Massilia sp.]